MTKSSKVRLRKTNLWGPLQFLNVVYHFLSAVKDFIRQHLCFCILTRHGKYLLLYFYTTTGDIFLLVLYLGSCLIAGGCMLWGEIRCAFKAPPFTACGRRGTCGWCVLLKWRGTFRTSSQDLPGSSRCDVPPSPWCWGRRWRSCLSAFPAEFETVGEALKRGRGSV